MDLPSDFFFHFHFLNWQLRGGVFLFVTVVVAAFCIFLDFCTLHATMNTFFYIFSATKQPTATTTCGKILHERNITKKNHAGRRAKKKVYFFLQIKHKNNCT
jgi:hypothetical protein